MNSNYSPETRNRLLWIAPWLRNIYNQHVSSFHPGICCLIVCLEILKQTEYREMVIIKETGDIVHFI